MRGVNHDHRCYCLKARYAAAPAAMIISFRVDFSHDHRCLNAVDVQLQNRDCVTVIALVLHRIEAEFTCFDGAKSDENSRSWWQKLPEHRPQSHDLQSRLKQNSA